jgi:hypothetical protein
MEKAGCQVWPRLIQAATCSDAGGYASGHGVCSSLLPFPHLLLPKIVAIAH